MSMVAGRPGKDGGTTEGGCWDRMGTRGEGAQLGQLQAAARVSTPSPLALRTPQSVDVRGRLCVWRWQQDRVAVVYS
jgi:hypothetical protein